MDKLTCQMITTTNQLKGYRRQSQSRSPGKFSNRRRSSSQTVQEDGICYYHQKFGGKSYKCQSHCKWARKDCTGCSLSATSVAGHLPSCLLYISDRKTGRRFLVDTGAAVSVIPPTAADRKHKQELGLRAVNGSPIPTYGTRSRGEANMPA